MLPHPRLLGGGETKEALSELLIFIRDLALHVGSHILLMWLVSEHPAVRSVTLPGHQHQRKGKRASEM